MRDQTTKITDVQKTQDKKSQKKPPREINQVFSDIKTKGDAAKEFIGWRTDLDPVTEQELLWAIDDMRKKAALARPILVQRKYAPFSPEYGKEAKTAKRGEVEDAKKIMDECDSQAQKILDFARGSNPENDVTFLQDLSRHYAKYHEKSDEDFELEEFLEKSLKSTRHNRKIIKDSSSKIASTDEKGIPSGIRVRDLNDSAMERERPLSRRKRGAAAPSDTLHLGASEPQEKGASALASSSRSMQKDTSRGPSTSRVEPGLAPAGTAADYYGDNYVTNPDELGSDPHDDQHIIGPDGPVTDRDASSARNLAPTLENAPEILNDGAAKLQSDLRAAERTIESLRAESGSREEAVAGSAGEAGSSHYRDGKIRNVKKETETHENVNDEEEPAKDEEKAKAGSSGNVETTAPPDQLVMPAPEAHRVEINVRAEREDNTREELENTRYRVENRRSGVIQRYKVIQRYRIMDSNEIGMVEELEQVVGGNETAERQAGPTEVGRDDLQTGPRRFMVTRHDGRKEVFIEGNEGEASENHEERPRMLTLRSSRGLIRVALPEPPVQIAEAGAVAPEAEAEGIHRRREVGSDHSETSDDTSDSGSDESEQQRSVQEHLRGREENRSNIPIGIRQLWRMVTFQPEISRAEQRQEIDRRWAMGQRQNRRLIRQYRRIQRANPGRRVVPALVGRRMGILHPTWTTTGQQRPLRELFFLGSSRPRRQSNADHSSNDRVETNDDVD